MIIIFCTDTYVDWTKIFLKSFKYTNGTDMKIHVNGLYLNESHIEELKQCYPKLTISNYSYEVDEICKRFGVTPNIFVECKDNISRGFKKDCRWWMDFIAVEERITKLLQTIQANPNEKYWLHFDVDMMFRQSIDPILDLVEKNNVTARFRPDRNFIKMNGKIVPEYMRICAGMIGFQNSVGEEFVSEWVNQIFKKMGEGVNSRGVPWGQHALYYAYQRFIDDYTWGEIPERWLTTSCGFEDPTWNGHKKGMTTVAFEDGSKVKVKIPNRKVFREDVFLPELKRLRKRYGAE